MKELGLTAELTTEQEPDEEKKEDAKNRSAA